jgi:hypothetical protein
MLRRSLAMIRRRESILTPLLSAFLDVADGRWDPDVPAGLQSILPDKG